MENKLALTGKMLQECKKPADVMDLPAVQDRWVNTYNLTTGKDNGLLKFEAEKVLFLQTISEDANLAKCSMVSIYSSFILLAVSGLSLIDGQSYLIPYKDKCVWMPGWKGRLEQIKQIPNINHVNEPVCIFEGEDFEYEIIEGEIKVLKHRPSLNTEGKQILGVYVTIEYTFGKKTFLMKREEVISIRNRYSQSYKDYIKIVPNAEGKRIKSGTSKTGFAYSFEIEEPMWISDEIQAFKKTLIKRVYNTIPKSSGSKYLDKRLSEAATELGINEKEVDMEDALEDKLRNIEGEFTDSEVVESNINTETVQATEETKTVKPPKVVKPPKAEKVIETIIAEEVTSTQSNPNANLFQETDETF